MTMLVPKIFFLLALLFCASGARGAEISARDVFVRLPESIFESTAEGLSEKDKQDLLTDGRSEFWELIQETPDSMIFSSLPFGEKVVGLRLFRHENDGGMEIVAGTMDDDPVCAIEFWRGDSLGRLVPVDGPDEPAPGEFLRPGKKIPRQGTVQLCLDFDGVAARPLFWSKKGMLKVPLDNEIMFRWSGDGFVKEVRRK